MSHVPLQYIDGFRFRMMIDWQPQGIARVSPIEFFSSRHGNLTIRPVTIEAGVVAGRAGFAALVTPQRRNVVLFECARDGSDLRRIDLGRCRVRHYRCAPHDAGSPDKIVERVTLHPGRLRITSLANGDYVAPNPVGEIRARVLFAEAQQQRPPEGSSSSK